MAKAKLKSPKPIFKPITLELVIDNSLELAVFQRLSAVHFDDLESEEQELLTDLIEVIQEVINKN